jgi:two-component system, NtrC family, nitrogen regulation response regulator NtrX
MTLKNKDEVRILIVDDEPAIGAVLSASLADEGYKVFVATDGVSGLTALNEFRPAIVLLDIWMPGELDGLEVLRRAKPNFPTTQFIMMSGHGTIETAVKATKLGAWDFVEKPLSIDKISILLSNILSFQSEREEKTALLNKLRKNIALVGESGAMKDLKQLVARVAPSQSWVLITGENGTGKELVAQNIHYLSARASRPFVDVNCAAIPAELIESELFGYEKGAFTGAEKAKKGKFDHAHGGTIFLDEIGDMSLEAQAKILRILQEKKFQRVGGSETIEVDVRVVAATNKNLDEEIKKGTFREDLYHRLNVIPIRMPALRERAEDIAGLVAHFGEQFARESGYARKVFSEHSLERMKIHGWSGNVRELRNFVERIYILTPGDFVDVHDLKIAGLSDSGTNFNTESSFRKARADFEKDFLVQKITEFGGNISKTAEAIGLERSYLHRKIKSYGIDA